MEVKGGHKQTEVGLIPMDWDVVPLGRLVTSVEYGSSAKSSMRGNTPVLRMGNLQGGRLDWSDLVYTDDGAEARTYRLFPGDVLFNRTNTIDLVGKTAIYKGERTAIFAGYLIRVKVDTAKLDSRFLNYVLNAEFSRKYSAKVLSVAVGQANINGQKLKTYPIPLPPTKAEQEAIAEALCDVDVLIESTEQLLAKKRDLRQGVMQELLAGKIRLPGFGAEWAVAPFSDVLLRLRLKNHQVQTSDYLATGAYPVVDQGREQIVGYSDRDDKVFRRPDGGVIVFGDHTCIVKFVDCDFVVGADGTQILAGKAGQCTRFHAFQLECSGVSPTGYNRHFKFLAERDLAVPSFREQTAIAAILSDMDEEIVALQAKLTKARQLKQGMMQELLTGRIRLV